MLNYPNNASSVEFYNKKSPFSVGYGLKELLTLALPSIVNMTSFTLMQFVDGWMVSFLGKEALGAQFGGMLVSFCFLCFFIGLISCVNVFASQNLGAGNYKKSALYAWQGIWLSLIVGLALYLIIPVAPYIYKIQGHDPSIIPLEVGYFNVMIIGAPFLFASRAMGGFFNGIHRPGITLIGGIAANVSNIIFNYALIFGNFGFPKLGLLGAAIATVLGNVIEFSLLFSVFIFGPIGRKFKSLSQIRFDFSAIKGLLKVGTPSGLTWASDTIVWAVFMTGIIGGLSTDHLTSVAILNRYWHLALMPASGIGIAITVIVGKYCGAQKFKLAVHRAYLAMALVFVYMLIAGIIIWILRDPLVSIFNATGDQTVQVLATSMFLFLLICQAFDGLCVVCLGILRGAGDTFWPGIIQVVLAWIVGLGGAVWLIRLFPNHPEDAGWSAISVYICLFGVALFLRFLQGKWKQIRLV